jgi:hypothetical protein
MSRPELEPFQSSRLTGKSFIFANAMSPIVDIGSGLVLILAGLAKVNNLQLFSKSVVELLPIVGGGFYFAVAVFAAEMACGCLLLAHPGDKVARRLALALFLVFAAVQAVRVTSHTENPCGCFGLLQGALLLRPFATPKAALLTNLSLASALCCADWISWRAQLPSKRSETTNGQI